MLSLVRSGEYRMQTPAVPLPKALRTLRPGVDDGAQVHRVMHLAAAKIEDLEEKVAQLWAALKHDAAGPS